MGSVKKFTTKKNLIIVAGVYAILMMVAVVVLLVLNLGGNRGPINDIDESLTVENNSQNDATKEEPTIKTEKENAENDENVAPEANEWIASQENEAPVYVVSEPSANEGESEPEVVTTADYNLNETQWIGFVIQSFVAKDDCEVFFSDENNCSRAKSGANIIEGYTISVMDTSYNDAARDAAARVGETSMQFADYAELSLSRQYSDYANNMQGTYNPKYLLSEYWCDRFGLSCARW